MPKPSIVIDNIVIEVPGTEYERRTYICTLTDNGRKIPFNIRLHPSTNWIEIEHRPAHEVDYDTPLDEDGEPMHL